MTAKIVKVFVPQSLDYFFDVWYNMIDVKIGLAAELFGQFGERRQMRHFRQSHTYNSVRGSLVGADIYKGSLVLTGAPLANLHARGSLSVVAP